MSLTEFSENDDFIRRIGALEQDLATTKTDLGIKAELNKGLMQQVGELETQLSLSEKAAALISKPPKWLEPKKSNKAHRGTVCTILSDTHFDEVVNPAEIGGINEYNREIATQRLETYFQKVIEISRDYIAGVEYDGVLLCLGGDMISGDIHEELKETNEDTILGTIVYWTEQLAAGIRLLHNHFGKVHIPCVVGNHGRRTRKPRMKLRVRDNFDWFMYVQLAQIFAENKDITFDIPDGPDCAIKVYDTNFLLTHGDQVKGGGGIGGIWPPIKRLQARKQVINPHDILLMGHWHQLIQAAQNGLVVNGSLKGYDEFAAICNFAPERPQQAYWITTPEHGVTLQAPIFV